MKHGSPALQSSIWTAWNDWFSEGKDATWSKSLTTVGTKTCVNDLTISGFAAREETVAK
jgi:hypothetical protein